MVTEKRENQRIIAYIDILGIRELTRSGKYSVITNALEIANALKSKKPILEGLEFNVAQAPTRKATVFSDTVVISYEALPHPLYYLTLVAEIAFFQAQLLLNNIVSRGAIVVGDMVHDEGLLYGKGLIEAYELEQYVARTPRVVLTNRFINTFRKSCEFLKENGFKKIEDSIKAQIEEEKKMKITISPSFPEQACEQLRVRLANFLQRDTDGLHFVDFIYISELLGEKNIRKKAIDLASEKRTELEKEELANYRVLTKYYWLRGYAENKKVVQEYTSPMGNEAVSEYQDFHIVFKPKE